MFFYNKNIIKNARNRKSQLYEGYDENICYFLKISLSENAFIYFLSLIKKNSIFRRYSYQVFISSCRNFDNNDNNISEPTSYLYVLQLLFNRL